MYIIFYDALKGAQIVKMYPVLLKLWKCNLLVSLYERVRGDITYTGVITQNAGHAGALDCLYLL